MANHSGRVAVPLLLCFHFEALLAQADAAKEAARDEPRNSRPRVGVKRQLRDRLLRETFQRYDEVANALGMAGRSGAGTKLDSASVRPCPGSNSGETQRHRHPPQPDRS